MGSAPAEAALGPALIGTLFNVFLFGTLVVQAYIYFTTYKKDPTWIKALIVALLSTDTFNTICDTIGIYEYLIKHFGDSVYMGIDNWALTTDPPLTGIIAMTVQLFFAWRIYVLTRSWIMTFIVIALSITGAVASFIFTHRAVVTPEFGRFQEFNTVVAVWLGSSAAADIVITCILVWYLQSHRTGFKGSDPMIDRIIRVTMQTGLLTSMTAIINIVLFMIYPTGTHMMINIPLCKLYSNSLLSSLNARGGWKYDDISSLKTSTSVEVRFANPSHAYLESKSPGETAHGSQQQIKIHRSMPLPRCTRTRGYNKGSVSTLSHLSNAIPSYKGRCRLSYYMCHSEKSPISPVINNIVYYCQLVMHVMFEDIHNTTSQLK
ncbi:hypothetical protein P691DRAFT_714374 [Macrolepiota fuliginosa MF-IS2]|uniref:DUF6534 domain-containing protein n=1 Tax=Macrolepiota fuliginosa MF-IS2 TaxID=1400762 RepID=A0A9P6BYG4_9AGAR|nr:hypothetical protein P691DRAFT_714374 [Macrolepiota fuliginosa MF-IS2]